MHAAADRLEFAPPPQPGCCARFVLAVLAHLLLVLALTWGVQLEARRRRTSRPRPSSGPALPQQAAPRPVAAAVRRRRRRSRPAATVAEAAPRARAAGCASRTSPWSARRSARAGRSSRAGSAEREKKAEAARRSAKRPSSRKSRKSRAKARGRGRSARQAVAEQKALEDKKNEGRQQAKAAPKARRGSRARPKPEAATQARREDNLQAHRGLAGGTGPADSKRHDACSAALRPATAAQVAARSQAATSCSPARRPGQPDRPTSRCDRAGRHHHRPAHRSSPAATGLGRCRASEAIDRAPRVAAARHRWPVHSPDRRLECAGSQTGPSSS